MREATEEYIAELAERGFDNKAERSLWEKIKDSFLDMLRKAGISLDFKLSDNNLRYILWRSYKNLEQGNLMDVAEDIVMRNRLGLNNINLNEMDQSKEILNLKKENNLLKQKVLEGNSRQSRALMRTETKVNETISTNQGELKTLLTELKTQLTEMEGRLMAKLTTMETNLTEEIRSIGTEVSGMESTVSGLSSDVQDLKTRVEALEKA